MRDGFLIQLITQLIEPGLVRRDHYAVACTDLVRAYELVRADHEITADQHIVEAGPLSGAFLRKIGMQEGDVRSLGCDDAEVKAA